MNTTQKDREVKRKYTTTLEEDRSLCFHCATRSTITCKQCGKCICENCVTILSTGKDGTEYYCSEECDALYYENKKKDGWRAMQDL